MRELIRLNFSKLKLVASSVSAKTKLAKNSAECIGEYVDMISNFTEYSNNLKEEEMALLTMSMQNWMTRRTIKELKGDCKVGDIFYTDFGVTYNNECSYPHPAVILEEIGNMLLVVPVTTSKDKVDTGFHPVKRKDGNKYYRLVEKDEDGLGETSVIMLSNVRTISKGRLLEKKGEMKDISKPDSIFREIKASVHKYYTPKENSELEKLKLANKDLQEKIEVLMRKIEELEDSKAQEKKVKTS